MRGMVWASVAATLAARGRRVSAILFAGSVVGGGLLEVLLKLVYARPRPDIVEPMGAETLVHAVESGADIRVVFDHRVPVAPGGRIGVRPRPGQVHVFDPQGQRVYSS